MPANRLSWRRSLSHPPRPPSTERNLSAESLPSRSWSTISNTLEVDAWYNMGSAEARIVLADSSKPNKLSLCRFAGVGDVDAIITDNDIDPELYDMLSACGAHIVTADEK